MPPREVDHYEVLDRNAGLSHDKCGCVGLTTFSAPRRPGSAARAVLFGIIRLLVRLTRSL